ncbi:nipped-B-like protein isoform X1 [Cucumis melo var. makuwa]|uniref:Nipped-B-like protein isoform X1 n=2 Tax=Cucumis melo var. makuwa TaxID=1194695 RepID=A0A5A7UQF8_CUCMM|nr:nipped-B-like protein isoform X1 [Cucumis melo var. makuwa]
MHLLNSGGVELKEQAAILSSSSSQNLHIPHLHHRRREIRLPEAPTTPILSHRRCRQWLRLLRYCLIVNGSSSISITVAVDTVSPSHKTGHQANSVLTNPPLVLVAFLFVAWISSRISFDSRVVLIGFFIFRFGGIYIGWEKKQLFWLRIYVAGLREEIVASSEQVLDLMEFGESFDLGISISLGMLCHTVIHFVNLQFAKMDGSRSLKFTFCSRFSTLLVGRSLFCLGLLIRYGSPLLSNSSNKNVDITKSLSLLKMYLQTEDLVIRALGFVLIARPEFMLQEDVGKIIEESLSSGSDVRLKMQALQNMYDYLLDAEGQMGTDEAGDGAGPDTVESGQSVPVAAGAGDTNICGGIVQLYWERILGRSLDLNGQVRQIALKAIVSLWVGAVISSWCNFITVLYVGHFLLEEDDKFLDKV